MRLESVIPDMAELVGRIASEMAAAPDRGRVADYIPGLAVVDPSRFAIAVELADGRCFEAGDTAVRFSVQSISKVFSLTLALGKVGDALWCRVSREPSGSAFNSIVQLEAERGLPRNPFVNAGAIVVADVMLGAGRPREAIGELLRFVRHVASDEDILIDEVMAEGERRTGHRNAALANYLRSFGRLDNEVEEVLGVYYNQCALAMTCRQLAKAGRYLMLDGRQPGTAGSVVSPMRARRINSLMLMCGHYDGSGEFAYRVGLPAKSGVGGGILAVAPGVASVAVWSPGINERGTSQLGALALERLVAGTGWSVFSPGVSPTT